MRVQINDINCRGDQLNAPDSIHQFFLIQNQLAMNGKWFNWKLSTFLNNIELCNSFILK